MKRHCRNSDEREIIRPDPGRCDLASCFAYTHEAGIQRSSNDSYHFSMMLPAMCCEGIPQNLTTSMSNSFLQLEMEGHRRQVLEDHKSRHHGKGSLSFADTLKHHPSLGAASFKYDFVSSHSRFNSYQQQRPQMPEEKSRAIPEKAIQSHTKKDGNGPLTMSGVISSPTAIKRNLLRHQSSPASVFSDFATGTGGIAARHIDPNGSSQLLQSAEYGDMVGYADGAGLTSLCDSPRHSKGTAGSLEGNSISHEGSLMSIFEGTASSRKRARGLDSFQVNVSSTSNVQDRLSEQGTSLTRHVSLPVPLKPKILPSKDHFLQDTVPCRLRAKRGCATHPRSIAERVRRTRISERIRKLQELVPSLDRQSNTADMLDEVVEYVKFLRRQVQDLSQSKARCESVCQQQANESQPS